MSVILSLSRPYEFQILVAPVPKTLDAISKPEPLRPSGQDRAIFRADG
jgi:hypothetical protein